MNAFVRQVEREREEMHATFRKQVVAAFVDGKREYATTRRYRVSFLVDISASSEAGFEETAAAVRDACFVYTHGAGLNGSHIATSVLGERSVERVK